VDLGKAPKKVGGGAAPDLEEAYDVCVRLLYPARRMLTLGDGTGG